MFYQLLLLDLAKWKAMYLPPNSIPPYRVHVYSLMDNSALFLTNKFIYFFNEVR